MGLKVTKANDYAIRAMIHLACLPPERVALRSQIAEAQDIPSSFMAKILRNLVRAGLLRSSRGVNGGFALARPAAEITMLDVVEAIEGPLQLLDCVPDATRCIHARKCPAGPVWTEVQAGIRRILGATSLEQLVSAPMRRGRLVSLPQPVAAAHDHLAG